MAYLTAAKKAQLLDEYHPTLPTSSFSALLDEIAAAIDADNFLKKISISVDIDDFTDGGAAVGTYIHNVAIPAKATVLFAALTSVVGFAGDTSAVLTIGDGTDVDRYNTGSINVFANANNGIAVGSPSGVLYHDAAKYPTLTVTTAADFTSVSAGTLVIDIYYVEN